MNLVADVKPDSSNDKILQLLLDKEWHSFADLMALGLHKGQVSAILHRLKYYFGYIIETQQQPHSSNLYRLVGRTVAAEPTTMVSTVPNAILTTDAVVPSGPVPVLGQVVTVVGLYRTRTGGVQVVLRSREDAEWTVQLQPTIPESGNGDSGSGPQLAPAPEQPIRRNGNTASAFVSS